MQTAVRWGTMASWKVCCIHACVHWECSALGDCLPKRGDQASFELLSFQFANIAHERIPVILVWISLSKQVSGNLIKPYTLYVFPHFYEYLFFLSKSCLSNNIWIKSPYSISVYDFILPTSQCTKQPIYSSYWTWSIRILDQQEIKIIEFNYFFREGKSGLEK